MMENSMRCFCKENYKLLENVNNLNQNVHPNQDTQYSILNYKKILEEIVEFLDGYIKYKDGTDDKYDGKIVSTTKSFYNNMFVDKNYRTIITLPDFKDMNKSFLKGTRDIQTWIEKKVDDTNDELKALIQMSDNQYRKLSKVYRDDMQIYLWLASSNSKYSRYNIDVKLRVDFEDENTPVMHAVKS